MSPDPRDLADQARKLGFRLKKAGKAKRFTTYVAPSTQEELRRAVRILGIQIQDAVAEALDAWLASKKGDLEREDD